MSLDELRFLKKINKEILDDDYTDNIKSMKNRLKESLELEKELTVRLKKLEKRWEEYHNNCHDCRKYNTNYRSIGVQTMEPMEPKPESSHSSKKM